MGASRVICPINWAFAPVFGQIMQVFSRSISYLPSLAPFCRGLVSDKVICRLNCLTHSCFAIIAETELTGEETMGDIGITPMRKRERRRGTGFVVAVIGAFAQLSPAGAEPFAYIANAGDGTISVVDTATNALAGPAISATGSSPLRIAVTPDAKRLYVATSNGVSVFDTSSKALLSTVAIAGGAQSVAVTPDGKRAYAANAGLNTVSVIDAATNTATGLVTVGAFPRHVTMAPDGARAYVSGGLGSVWVIDTATNSLVTTIGPLPASNVMGAAISSDGRRLYVATSNTGDFGMASLNALSIIDTATNAVANVILTGATTSSVQSLALSSDGATLYMPDRSGAMWTVSAATSAISQFPIPTGAAETALTADGKRAYVTSPNSNIVSVIDTAARSVSATVAAGLTPYGVAIAPVMAPPTTPFTTFTASLSVTSRLNAFTLNGRFTLGAANNGILPLSETVKLSVGPYSVTLPSGSFRRSGSSAIYSGTINKARLSVTISPVATGTYALYANVSNISLRGLTNPALVAFGVGNDAGTVSVRPRF